MKKRMMVISYAPLLEGYTSNMEKEEAIEKLKNINPGEIKNCLWADSDAGIYPVFTMDNAKKIKKHIEFWAEHNVQNWFDLCIIDKGERYFILLWPNLLKSKDRHLYNHMVVHEEIIIESEWEFLFAFCPLVFVSLDRGMLDKVKGLIREETYLGFIDTCDMNVDDPIKTVVEPALIGPLKVHFRHELAEKYLDAYKDGGFHGDEKQ